MLRIFNELASRLAENLNKPMKMLKELRFREIIETIIGEINEVKRCAKTIHSAGNIKASGDKVENLRERLACLISKNQLEQLY